MQGQQLALPFRRGWGGAREGAGRKARPPHLRQTPHRARAKHQRAEPVHVTLRAGLRCLRREFVARVVLKALRDSNRGWFRIVHYSIQANHVHLLVEASETAGLISCMRGLLVRVARRVNRALGRRGRFWADRWHGHALATPSEVRNALVYVLQNHHKHTPAGRMPVVSRHLDSLSSAAHFDGFAEPIPRTFRSIGPPCTMSAATWLLRTGWRRRGLIRLNETPLRWRT